MKEGKLSVFRLLLIVVLLNEITACVNNTESPPLVMDYDSCIAASKDPKHILNNYEHTIQGCNMLLLEIGAAEAAERDLDNSSKE